MVSYIPERAPSSVSSSSNPPSPKAVNFAGVSGVSRPVTHHEQWACYWFEQHAYECDSCREPSLRYKAGKRLCRDGNKLAATISNLLFRKDSEVYSRVKEDGQKPRVEKPTGYDRSWQLLKAIERASKHKQSFLMSEKKTTSEPSKRERHDSLSPQTHQVRPVYARKPSLPVETYERQPSYTLPLRQVHTQPADYTAQPNPFAQQQPDPQSNRGSLYETELARQIERERRESQMGYKMELPERVPRLSARGSVRRKERPHTMVMF